MEYHQQLNTYHTNQYSSSLGAHVPPGQSNITLPDASSSSEKALMWPGSNTYMSESGYSTQAPSISSIDAFLNNDAQPMDSTIQNASDTASIISATSSTNTATVQNVNVAAAPQYAQLQPPPPPPPQQQQQQQQIAQAEPHELAENDNAVANWINSQENSEMAIKAIPDLLKLLVDEDLVVVQQAAILLNQIARMEAPRQGLIQTPHAVQCLVDCLITTADIETARSLVGALYGISAQKTTGVQAIINSTALQPLIKMLSAPTETIISYAITTLHNVLLDCGDKVKLQMRKMGAIQSMIQLLQFNHNVKFLSIVVDCLQLLAVGNQEAKKIILESRGTQFLVQVLHTHAGSYHKLLLNLTRIFKTLSVCNQNKQALIHMNLMQALAVQLNAKSENGVSKSQHDTILQNILVTLRNLSDAAVCINGLEQLVSNLVQFLASNADFTLLTLAAGILSNLTVKNENNKKSAMRSNGVQVLLKLLQQNLLTQKFQLLEPCICALRHITNRHADMLLCQEQIRTLNGFVVISQLMSMQPRSWACVKALLGLVRNLCSNQLNATHLRQNQIIEKLMQILYDAYTEINARTNHGMTPTVVVKLEDVSLSDIIEASSAALLILAKEYANQIRMKELDCITFFVQMFYSPLAYNQKAASSLLAELAMNKECADVIEQQAGLQQFIQANFCNQFGMLKSIAELSNNNPNSQSSNSASVVLQNVHTLMQRLQEHKNAARQVQPPHHHLPHHQPQMRAVQHQFAGQFEAQYAQANVYYQQPSQNGPFTNQQFY